MIIRRRILREDEFDLHMPMLARRATDLECPLEWAQDSNSFDCSTGTFVKRIPVHQSYRSASQY